jgi:hypothetical protein
MPQHRPASHNIVERLFKIQRDALFPAPMAQAIFQQQHQYSSP